MSSEDQLNVTTLANYCDQLIKANHISFMAYYIMCIFTRSINSIFVCANEMYSIMKKNNDNRT
jgi:hypothetical protein